MFPYSYFKTQLQREQIRVIKKLIEDVHWLFFLRAMQLIEYEFIPTLIVASIQADYK
jgi:hypothetical protein